MAFRSALGGLPRAYWYLWAGMLLNRIGSFVLPLLALYLTQRGFGAAEVGTTITLFGVGSIVGNQLGGALADQVGRRSTLLCFLVLGAGSMVALGFARDHSTIAGCTLALGLFGEAYRPAMQAMIADLVPAHDRARAFGLSYWANNLGFAIASVLAGLLAKVSWVIVFLGDAATTLGYAAVVLVFLAETRPAASSKRSGWDALRVPFRDPVYLAFWVLSVLTACVFMQHVVSLPLAMRLDGLGSEDFGRVLAVNGVLIVLVQPWLAPVLARHRRSSVLALGTAVIGLGYGLTAFADTGLLYALTVAVWTLGEIAVLPTASAVVADLAPADLRGTYQGAHNIAWGVSWVVGPVVGTQALERLGAGLWGGCLAVALAVCAGHLAFAEARERRLGERV